MRDRDIRVALRREIEATYSGDANTLIIEEMGVCEGNARIDIAVVNGALIGFEIKSEVDTLQRLPHQAEVYSRLLDQVTVVSSALHLNKAKTIIPEWWGLTEAFIENGVLRFSTIRVAQTNSNIDPFSLAQLLWRDEALSLLRRFSLHKGLRSKPRKEIWNRLANARPLDELRECVRDTLRTRQNWRAAPPPQLGDD